MNCDGSPNLAWTQHYLYIPQQTLIVPGTTLSFEKESDDASGATRLIFCNCIYINNSIKDCFIL